MASIIRLLAYASISVIKLLVSSHAFVVALCQWYWFMLISRLPDGHL